MFVVERRVEGERQKQATVEPLSRLMKIECRLFEISIINGVPKSAMKALSAGSQSSKYSLAIARARSGVLGSHGVMKLDRGRDATGSA